MCIEGITKQKAKQLEYVFSNWLDQVEIKESKDDPELCNVQFFGECPFIMRYSNLNAIIIELGTKYISLDKSDFFMIKIF